MKTETDDEVIKQLTTAGVLRAAINLSNPLLVTGRSASGDPVGVSPDMARTVAERIGVPVEYRTFPSPGAVADAASENRWDIALIANEPKRAETISFSPAYCEIEATYLVRADSEAIGHDDLDRPSVRIAVSARSAYDLYLSRTLRHAELVRGEGLPGALDVFVGQGTDALAGLRPALLQDAEGMPGARVLEGHFTTVRQAIGVQPQHAAAAEFLARLIRELRSDGTVKRLIDRHGVTGRLLIGSD